MGMTEIELFVERCRDETEMVSRLIVLLEQEQGALVAGDIMQLEPLADSKTLVLEALAEKGKARQLLTRQLGLSGLTEVRAWVADKQEARQAWVMLEDTMQKAQVLNQFNGRYIDQGLETTQRALKALKAAAAATMGYGRDGSQAPLPVGGRHLGSA